MQVDFDTVIIGGGAAGMMSAVVAGRRGKRVLVLDHAKKLGEKIRISGGGRCNFTNIYTTSKNFLSSNRHFAKSALNGYQPQDFIALIDSHGISWHEKTKGQLFCDETANNIVTMMREEMARVGVDVREEVSVQAIEKLGNGFVTKAAGATFQSNSLIIACGGKSIPKIGASGFGFEVAQQFGLRLVETAPALVPLIFSNDDLGRFKALAGVSVPVRVSCGKAEFDEELLFTHRGLSGPAILQISSFWREGLTISIHFAPEIDFADEILSAKQTAGRKALTTLLAGFLPKRLAQDLVERFGYGGNIADMNRQKIEEFAHFLENFVVTPASTEGYRTAEVTRGGVDTNELNAKTMESKSVPGLYFIGEVVDVTGWLGGYNFQWAWASGHAAGMAIC